jgi:hypothetical protein
MQSGQLLESEQKVHSHESQAIAARYCAPTTRKRRRLLELND